MNKSTKSSTINITQSVIHQFFGKLEHHPKIGHPNLSEIGRFSSQKKQSNKFAISNFLPMF
jgi:hypothetical protein